MQLYLVIHTGEGDYGRDVLESLVRRLDVQIATTCAQDDKITSESDLKDKNLQISSSGISMPQPAAARQRPKSKPAPAATSSSQRPSMVSSGGSQTLSNSSTIKSRQASLKTGYRVAAAASSSLARFSPITNTRDYPSSMAPNEDEDIIYWYKYDRRSKMCAPIYDAKLIALPLKIPIGE